ncbi:MAG TPA: hypothetical protein VM389_13945, partial [Phycisphaerae bacterium]|nr:hypothetical protein [Phycisphaerae bacterium]
MTTVLSDHRFRHTRPGFSAADLLRRINSPRLQDMPGLAECIDEAADAAGISRELMCCIPQKEQSGLTERRLSSHALADFCGYDGGDGIPQPGTEGPERQLLSAARCLRYWFYRWTPGLSEICPYGIVTPTNAATYALYRYTPGAQDKTNLLQIWEMFDLGNPLATEETTMSRIIAPIADFSTAQINATLHGRSVYRSEDVPGHNVFKGYSTWGANGHRGVGDGLDICGQGWRTPVVAAFDGVQTVFNNDMR